MFDECYIEQNHHLYSECARAMIFDHPSVIHKKEVRIKEAGHFGHLEDAYMLDFLNEIIPFIKGKHFHHTKLYYLLLINKYIYLMTNPMYLTQKLKGSKK